KLRTGTEGRLDTTGTAAPGRGRSRGQAHTTMAATAATTEPQVPGRHDHRHSRWTGVAGDHGRGSRARDCPVPLIRAGAHAGGSDAAQPPSPPRRRADIA